jgi:hypothetical protein
VSRTAFPGATIPQAIDGPSLTDEDLHAADFKTLEEYSEPALWLVLKEADASKIVSSVESGHAYETVAILKQQPWWVELCACA